jgi:hypothetical protein
MYEGIAGRATSWLIPVFEFYDLHVHAGPGRSVQAGIGEVLDPKARIGMRERIHANSRGCDELNRTPEVLYAERMVAEESCSHSGIEGDKAIPAVQHNIRHCRHHQTALICPCQ